eukprot:753438-Hanusia_phi.AAC.1
MEALGIRRQTLVAETDVKVQKEGQDFAVGDRTRHLRENARRAHGTSPHVLMLCRQLLRPPLKGLQVDTPHF